MAFVKTFRINPEFGIPDRDIREWLTNCEKKAIIAVQAIFIPPVGTADPRLTVIVTKLDELHALGVQETPETGVVDD
jgi:hypothetical protein